jgi:hypothetical protein
MIQPTVGRIVWYQPNPAKGDPPPIFLTQPFVGIVTCVNTVRNVSLVVYSHRGESLVRNDVTLAQDDDLVEKGMAEWMPFQKGQVAKLAPAQVDQEFMGRVLDALDALQIRIAGVEALTVYAKPIEPPPPPPPDSQTIVFSESKSE